MKPDPTSAPRLYLDTPLTGDVVRIGAKEAHYLSHVLRLKAGSNVVVFDGRGRERLAAVKSLARHAPELTLGDALPALPESSVEIILIQGLIKSEAMDMVVQKATELGVRRVLAVKTDYSVIKLDAERGAKRRAHWERIARSACEQSRRHYAPDFDLAASLAAALATLPRGGIRVAFHAEAERHFSSLDAEGTTACLAVGPEGGFSPGEIDLLVDSGFALVRLGERTLRAETAALAACSLAQLSWGDFA